MIGTVPEGRSCTRSWCRSILGEPHEITWIARLGDGRRPRRAHQERCRRRTRDHAGAGLAGARAAAAAADRQRGGDPALSRPADDHDAAASSTCSSRSCRGRGLHSRPVRRRQDGAAQPDRPPFRCRCRDISSSPAASAPARWWRRSRSSRGSRIRAHRRFADGPHRHHLQRVLDAGRVTRRSIYTGITIGEYYRQMGLRTLVIADSTSRWAQAMRETSRAAGGDPRRGGVPPLLDSAIKGVYERAGVVRAADGAVGALRSSARCRRRAAISRNRSPSRRSPPSNASSASL